LGDRGYGSNADRAMAYEAGIALHTAHRASRGKKLTFQQELENKVIASLQAIVEFPFRIVKRQWGHATVRYRGLAKNTAQLHTLFALANLYQVRSQLLPS
jgi:transposase, IS5 family